MVCDCFAMVQGENGNLLAVVQSLSVSYEEISDKNASLLSQMEVLSGRVTSLTHDLHRTNHLLEIVTKEKEALEAQAASCNDTIAALRKDLENQRAVVDTTRKEVSIVTSHMTSLRALVHGWCTCALMVRLPLTCLSNVQPNGRKNALCGCVSARRPCVCWAVRGKIS